MKTLVVNSDDREIALPVAIFLAAGILAGHGQQGVIDTRPKILAMLKARDEATRSDAATAGQKRS